MTASGPPDVFVLECYPGEPVDGLSDVQSLVRSLGPTVDDSPGLSGKTILVAGLPFQHGDRLSRANRTGGIAEWIELDGQITELFDITVIPGCRRPSSVLLNSPNMASLITIEGETQRT